MRKLLRLKVIQQHEYHLHRIQVLHKNPDEYLKDSLRIADVNDYNSLQKAMSGIEQIYHCAAIVS